jgi:hypothetical protein
MGIDYPRHQHRPLCVDLLIAQLWRQINLSVNFMDALILYMHVTEKILPFVNDARVLY